MWTCVAVCSVQTPAAWNGRSVGSVAEGCQAPTPYPARVSSGPPHGGVLCG